MTTEITMIQKRTIIKESDILKKIKRNMTREKEVVQTLKKEDSLTWEEDGLGLGWKEQLASEASKLRLKLAQRIEN